MPRDRKAYERHFVKQLAMSSSLMLEHIFGCTSAWVKSSVVIIPRSQASCCLAGTPCNGRVNQTQAKPNHSMARCCHSLLISCGSILSYQTLQERLFKKFDWPFKGQKANRCTCRLRKEANKRVERRSPKETRLSRARAVKSYTTHHNFDVAQQ